MDHHTHIHDGVLDHADVLVLVFFFLLQENRNMVPASSFGRDCADLPVPRFFFSLPFYRDVATWSLRAGLGWTALMFPYLTLKPMPVCIGYLNLTTCIEMMKKVGT